MKKNIAMRVAAFLFILTMISTCAFATTFAKYTTEGSANDSARVAKWGVEVEVESAAFSQWYKDEVVAKDNATLTVAGSEKVVAPGTEGTLFTVEITGQPEVDAQVELVFTFDLGDNWVAKGSYYCPLEITVGTTTFKGTSYSSADEFEKAVKDAVLAAGKNADATESNGVYTYDANENLAVKFTVTWKWAFEGNDDVKDTVLGEAATTANAPEISFNIKCTVTQID